MTPGDSAGLRCSVEKTIRSLLGYCARENWAGYDPYDGLNSRLLSRLGFFRGRVPRLAVTQAMKRLPLNLRPLLLVSKGETPKACALFCSSLIRLSGEGFIDDDSLIRSRVDRLVELRSPHYERFCWGYNFDWQNRGFLLPRYEPNIICTTFGGNALLDAYEKYGERSYLEGALSAGEFLLHDLNITKNGDELCFSYTCIDNSQIHNANLLGAALIARIARLTKDSRLMETARKAMRFSKNRQGVDGSWSYGEAERQQWIDNFHTGYNLTALRCLAEALDDGSARDALAKGFAFYLDHFFPSDGIPSYYHDRVWPIDIHAVAQSIITLCELSELDGRALPLATAGYRWACANLWSDRGYFYYQKTRLYTNRISYMRWSQAWMLSALSFLLCCT